MNHKKPLRTTGGGRTTTTRPSWTSPTTTTTYARGMYDEESYEVEGDSGAKTYIGGVEHEISAPSLGLIEGSEEYRVGITWV